MKKYIAYMLSVLLITSLLLSPINTNQIGTKVAHAETTLSIKATKTIFELGSTSTLTIKGTESEADWSSSNEDCIYVDSDGLATAYGVGTSIITAFVDGQTLTYQLTVVEEQTSLNNTSVILNVGKKDFINVTGKNTGKVKKATWATSDKNVATVSKTGVITAVKVGKAVISATYNGKKYSCNVSVKEKIALTKSSLSLKQGQSHQLTFKGISYRAEWSTSNAKVAYVDLEGKVIAVAPGTATITGRVDGTNYKCNVTVTKLTTINQRSILTYVGDSKTKLTVPGIPAKTTIKWSTSNKKCVTVSSNGTLNIIAAGTVTITATVGSKNYTFFIVSVNKGNPYVSKAPFEGVEKIQDKVHFVVPKSWDYEEGSILGEYGFTLTPKNSSLSSSIAVTINKTDKPSTDYFTFKNKIVNEGGMSEEAIKSLNALLSMLGGAVTSFKENTYLSSHGNVYKMQYTMIMMGMRAKMSTYEFNLGQYDIKIEVSDMDDYANLQKYVDYIINSIYVK